MTTAARAGTEPETGQTAGYVVAVTAASGSRLVHLTSADLMDEQQARAEQRQWTAHPGAQRKYVLCRVIEEERRA